jgi:hypothetical protein
LPQSAASSCVGRTAASRGMKLMELVRNRSQVYYCPGLRPEPGVGSIKWPTLLSEARRLYCRGGGREKGGGGPRCAGLSLVNIRTCHSWSHPPAHGRQSRDESQAAQTPLGPFCGHQSAAAWLCWRIKSGSVIGGRAALYEELYCSRGC